MKCPSFPLLLCMYVCKILNNLESNVETLHKFVQLALILHFYKLYPIIQKLDVYINQLKNE